MQDLKITDSSIAWTQKKERFGSPIEYRTEIFNCGDHIGIIRDMVVNGEVKNSDLVHIPLELINKIKDLKETNGTESRNEIPKQVV